MPPLSNVALTSARTFGAGSAQAGRGETQKQGQFQTWDNDSSERAGKWVIQLFQ